MIAVFVHMAPLIVTTKSPTVTHHPYVFAAKQHLRCPEGQTFTVITRSTISAQMDFKPPIPILSSLSQFSPLMSSVTFFSHLHLILELF
jgi:hypothetical protein